MTHRFLDYSLRHQKPIKAILMDEEGKIRNLTVRVTRLSDEGFYYTQGKKKQEHFAPFESALSFGYARGDKGEIDLYGDTK
jgi:hypothetical protein